MRKILIANRGEIAVRIARACDDAGLESVAIYADVDADALHASTASEAYSLEGNSPAETYLNVAKILAIAARSGSDAVHPGYGFLSENADFAQAVIDAGLTWIGPSPEAIRALGNKVTARRIALQAKAPLVAGSDGPVASAAEVRKFAEEHGLPVAVKAAYGGGGRGLKVIRDMEAIEESYDSAVREAVVAFGRGECFVEQYLDRPRHVEAQVLADQHGNVIVVGTRDCTLQRRHQKLVEEAPAPFLTEDQLSRIREASKAICKEAGYYGAGTVEFLVSATGAVAFLEVNTRLQVEHPVTEETSGIDLVQAQFKIAAGLPLDIAEDPLPRGHAFEFRINAEDVGRGFLPTPGTITEFTAPSGPGVRLDTGFLAGSTIPGQFDSLIAKLIVTGADRQQALRRARRALKELNIAGLPTVLPFHRAVVTEPDFCSDSGFRVHTRWIETDFAGQIPADPSYDPAKPAAGRRTFAIDVDGRRVNIGLPAELLNGLLLNGIGGAVTAFDATGNGGGAPTPEVSPAAEGALLAPMSGKIVKWLAAPGTLVAEGDAVVVLEAMKMETSVPAHRSGTLSEIAAAIGSDVRAGSVLATVTG